SLLFFMVRCPPTSSLFPYTTLFRSAGRARRAGRRAGDDAVRRAVRVQFVGAGSGGKVAGTLRVPSARRPTECACYYPSAACSSRDRKSTRLNSSHVKISYAVFCLKK